MLGELWLRLGDRHGAMRAAVSAAAVLGDADRDEEATEARWLRQRISALTLRA
ncbi:hypothetical protein [Dactylosporangium sp. CA-233914]|uniref:hypothetical protein n=1 Tax=Dactylosporangium sp. CA-233914 TaxID=3239934 RepID=UPI003D8B3153